jgi:hypothetical protein
LILNGLELLPLLNGKRIEDMSGSRRRRFAITPLKLIVFSNQSDVPMRIELFNRINSNRT